MNTQQLDAAIRAQIDQFLVSISTLVRQAAVESVREALGAEGGSASPANKRGPGRPRKAAADGATAATGSKRGRRASADIEKASAEIREYISANPGQRLEEIGRGLGSDTAELKRPIQTLLAAGAVRTEGKKRGTKYFPAGGRSASSAGESSKRRARKMGKRARRAAGKKTARKGRKSPKAKLLRLPEKASAA